uniref:Uncharacterized protein n=1 Tax=Rhizophora mucronata TaxID=61149 RepID=A0A2P2Q0M0_RHIMU
MIYLVKLLVRWPHGRMMPRASKWGCTSGCLGLACHSHEAQLLFLCD